MYLTPILLGRTSLEAAARLGKHAPGLDLRQPLCQALRRLFVQLTRNRRRPTFVRQAAYRHQPDQITDLDLQHIIRTYLPTGLDAIAHDPGDDETHTSALYRLLRQAARLEESRRPQPFVDAQPRGNRRIKQINGNSARHERIITRMTHIPTLSLAIPVLAVMVSACSHAPQTAAPGLGVLQLREAVRIDPNAATVRLQYGGIVARNAVQEQDPFCVFEIDTVRPQAQTVAPGTFRIVAITRSVETIAGISVLPTPWRVRSVAFGDDDGPTHIYYKTIFRLGNDRPDVDAPVRALTCMSNQNAPGNANLMRHLTLTEIRGALGQLFTLKLTARQDLAERAI